MNQNINHLYEFIIASSILGFLIGFIILIITCWFASIGSYLIGKMINCNIKIIRTTPGFIFSGILFVILAYIVNHFFNYNINDNFWIGLILISFLNGLFLAKLNELGFIRSIGISFFGTIIGIIILILVTLAIGLIFTENPKVH